MKRTFIGIALLSILWGGPALGAATPVGMVKTLSGEASISRGDLTLPVSAGALLMEGDTIKTAREAALGFILKDNTLMTLGPDSELVISRFLYAPAEENLSLVVRMLKGTATFLTGIIGKLSPEAVKIETPEATIGIRGTRFALRVS